MFASRDNTGMFYVKPVGKLQDQRDLIWYYRIRFSTYVSIELTLLCVQKIRCYCGFGQTVIAGVRVS